MRSIREQDKTTIFSTLNLAQPLLNRRTQIGTNRSRDYSTQNLLNPHFIAPRLEQGHHSLGRTLRNRSTLVDDEYTFSVRHLLLPLRLSKSSHNGRHRQGSKDSRTKATTTVSGRARTGAKPPKSGNENDE
jgi:hypothetical protein